MNNFEITTLDIALFFYKRDIKLKKRTEIIIDLWNHRKKYLEYYMYDNLRIFSNEINNLLIDISLDNIIFNEIEEIIKIQKELESKYIGYGYYKVNKNRIEEFLKLCKLRVMYESKEDYIYMKFRTVVKACGYKRRTKKMIAELTDIMSELELYMSDGQSELTQNPMGNTRKIVDVRMDEYIRIYSY